MVFSQGISPLTRTLGAAGWGLGATGTLQPDRLGEPTPPTHPEASHFSVSTPASIALGLAAGATMVALGAWGRRTWGRYSAASSFLSYFSDYHPPGYSRREVMTEQIAKIRKRLALKQLTRAERDEIFLNFLGQASHLPPLSEKEGVASEINTSLSFFGKAPLCNWDSRRINAFIKGIIDRYRRYRPESHGSHDPVPLVLAELLNEGRGSLWEADELFGYLQSLAEISSPHFDSYGKAVRFLKTFETKPIRFADFIAEEKRYKSYSVENYAVLAEGAARIKKERLGEADRDEIVQCFLEGASRLEPAQIELLSHVIGDFLKRLDALFQHGDAGRIKEVVEDIIGLATAGLPYDGPKPGYILEFLSRDQAERRWSADELCGYLKRVTEEARPDVNPYDEAGRFLKAFEGQPLSYSALMVEEKRFRNRSGEKYGSLALGVSKIVRMFSDPRGHFPRQLTDADRTEITSHFMDRARLLDADKIEGLADEVCSSLGWFHKYPLHAWSPGQVKDFAKGLIDGAIEGRPCSPSATFKRLFQAGETAVDRWSSDEVFDYLMKTVKNPDLAGTMDPFLEAFPEAPCPYDEFNDWAEKIASYPPEKRFRLAQGVTIMRKRFLGDTNGREVILYFLEQASKLPVPEEIPELAGEINDSLGWFSKRPLHGLNREQVKQFVRKIIDRAVAGLPYRAKEASPSSVLSILFGKESRISWSGDEIFEWMQMLAEDSRVDVNPYGPAYTVLGGLQEFSVPYPTCRRILRETNKTNAEVMASTLAGFVVPRVKTLDRESDQGAVWELFIKIIKDYPYDGLRIAQDLFGEFRAPWNFDRHLLSEAERGRVLEFIGLTRFFDASLYAAWKKDPEKLTESLGAVYRATEEDHLTQAQIGRLRKDYGDITAMHILRLMVPAGSASMIGKDELTQYMIRRQALGDRSGHVPKSWKTLRKSDEAVFRLNQGVFLPRDGQEIDPEGRLERWVPHLLQDPSRETSSKHLAERILAYVYDPAEAGRLAVWDALLGCVGRRGNIDMRSEPASTRLKIIENLFTDKDEVRKELARAVEAALKTIDWKKVKMENRPADRLANLDAVARSLDGIWGKRPADAALVHSARLLLRVSPEDWISLAGAVTQAGARRYVEDLIAGRRKLESPVVDADDLRRVLHRDLIDSVLTWVRGEKAKFDYFGTAPVRVRLRAVKGLAYAHWTTGAGVCIYDDTHHWNDPDFVLLAPEVEYPESFVPSRSEGFLASKVATIDDKKYLTLPGINPSVELLTRTDVSELVTQLMNRARRYAKAEGCEAILIPTKENIFSNRKEIQAEVKRRFGKNVMTWTKSVRWHASDYNFNSAYVVSLEEEPEPEMVRRKTGGPARSALPLPLESGR